MANPFDIYARAVRRLPLTPGERALLRTADQLLLSALAGAGVAILQAAVSGQQPLTFASLGQIAAYAAATAGLTGAAKLFRAQGDPIMAPVADALDGVAARIASVAPVPPPPAPQQRRVQSTPRAQQPAPPVATFAVSEAATTAERGWSLPAARRADLLRAAGAAPIGGSGLSFGTRRDASGAGVSGATRPVLASAAPEPPSPPPEVATPAPPLDEALGDGAPTIRAEVVAPADAEPVTEQRAAVRPPTPPPAGAPDDGAWMR